MIKLIRKLIPQSAINKFKHLPTAILANLIYGFPSRKIKVIGVTGTDGKTTTVNMIYQILKAAGKRVSMVSTVNAVIGSKKLDTGFHVTSPDPLMVQKLIRQSVRYKDEYIVLEVTSHALDQYRFWGVNFMAAVITNITHEHLDYHKRWENYFYTKAKLIKDAKIAVINRDETHYLKLASLANGDVYSFGLSREADFNPTKFPIRLNIFGEFNLLNALAAATLTINLNIDGEIVRNSLAKFKLPIGRMDEIKNERGFKIYIDFAHTPNGLSQALKALNKQKKGRIIAIIGAEGYRDEQKRPMMGEIATKLSDIVIITSVDPRGLIEQINNQIMQGVKRVGGILGENIFIENNRLKAIDLALNQLAKKGDTIAIFGKGHEKTMNLDGKGEVGWSDYLAVEKSLNG